MTLGSAVTAGGPLRWQSASTVEGEGGSRTSEGDEGGALADHGARMVQGGLHHAGIGGKRHCTLMKTESQSTTNVSRCDSYHFLLE